MTNQEPHILTTEQIIAIAEERIGRKWTLTSKAYEALAEEDAMLAAMTPDERAAYLADN